MKYYLVHNFNVIRDVIAEELQVKDISKNVYKIAEITQEEPELIINNTKTGLTLLTCLAIRGAFSKMNSFGIEDLRNLYYATVQDITKSFAEEEFKDTYVCKYKGKYSSINKALINSLLEYLEIINSLESNYTYDDNALYLSQVLGGLMLTVNGVAKFIYTPDGKILSNEENKPKARAKRGLKVGKSEIKENSEKKVVKKIEKEANELEDDITFSNFSHYNSTHTKFFAENRKRS